MSCKHEGGTDPCVKYPRGDCQVYRRQHNRKYLLANRQHSFVSGKDSHTECCRVGAVSELLVQADLLLRGYEVTIPVNTGAKHDLHANLPSRGWVGVQVKTARLNRSTNNLSLGSGLRHIQSPVLALVFPPTKRIVYRAGTEELPEEFRDANL
jgi:hypothetical protein